MSMTHVSVKNIRWEYLSESGQAWLQGLDDGTAAGKTVKESVKRRVVALSGIYFKEVYYRGIAALLKSVGGGGSACVEGRMSRKLAEQGLSAPEVIGYGKEVGGVGIRRDVLLTREVAGATSLFDFMHGGFLRLSFHAQNTFLGSLADYLRRLHDVGALHADLHIGNILLTPAGDGFDFVLLDNDRLSFKANLSHRQRIKNLALILSNLQGHISRAQTLRMLYRYGVPHADEGRRFLASLVERAHIHTTRICNGKARQSLANNRRFSKEFRHGFRVYRKNDTDAEKLVEALLPDPDRILETAEICKAGRTVRAGRVNFDGHSYFLKRYNCKGLTYSLRNAFRRSRAVRTWLVSWGFLARGIAVPEPIVCLEERRHRLLRRSYVVFEFIQDSVPLSHCWPGLDTNRRKDILTRLGSLLGRMHRFGCVHGDLKWGNILVSQSATIVLTDLDGSRIVACGRRQRSLRDLDRFLQDLANQQVSAADREYFLSCWRRRASLEKRFQRKLSCKKRRLGKN